MRNIMYVLGMLLLVGILIVNGVSYSFDRAIEAEMADTIEEPMVVAEDDGASDGKYVWMEGEPLTGGGDQGWIEFKIDIPTAGTYALWGHVFVWDGNSDSFWVTWQPADPDEDAQVTKNTEYRWSIGTKNAWHWDRINHWLDGGTFDREWELPAGESTLRIAVREDAAKIDVVFITDNLSDNVDEVNPRFPGPEDVTPVEPQAKLTTTWGNLKSQW
ncbi:hypothetical protein F4212_03295 [Candidatus Poribacteria bacterium]|nr:hypothetical protein [Candidatus Poribacteria bacterium]